MAAVSEMETARAKAKASVAAAAAAILAMDTAVMAVEADLAAADMADVYVEIDQLIDAPNVRYTLHYMGIGQHANVRKMAVELLTFCNHLEQLHEHPIEARVMLHCPHKPMDYFKGLTATRDDGRVRVMSLESIDEDVVLTTQRFPRLGRATKACRAGAGAEEEE